MIRSTWCMTRLGLMLLAVTTIGALGQAAEPATEVRESIPAVQIRPVSPVGSVEVAPRVEKTEEEQPQEPEVDQLSTPTHKQTRKITTKHNGIPVHLSTFCLDAEGNVLACVTTNGENYGVVPAPASKEENVPVAVSYVQKYSPEGELVAEWPLEFNATAINVAADRTIFVAGAGHVARLSAKGEVLTSADTPSTVRTEVDIQAEIARAKEANVHRIELFQQQLARIAESIAKVEETPEADRTDRDRAKLELYSRQRTIYEQQIQILQDPTQKPAPASSRAKVVTALALSGENLFICCGSEKGHGYDVWRCGLDFQNPAIVITGLGGCCGQCDVQAMADDIVVAENTRFRVGLYNADGKSLSSFGDRDRTSKAGFGSCCNPMNVRCCSNGDIITAESSIGNIKRFSRDGEFKSFVGKARVSGGCKHVAVGWDEKRDRYYLMNITDQSICVLVPLAEAPEFTEEELAAKLAREGLGKKLLGKWTITKPVEKTAVTEGATTARKPSLLSRAISALSGDDEEVVAPGVRSVKNVMFEELELTADGTLKVSGGVYGSLSANHFTWEAVQQEGKTIEFDLLSDGVQYFRLKGTFESDNQIVLGMSQLGGPVNPATYYRLAVAGDAEPEDETLAMLDLKFNGNVNQPLADLVSDLGKTSGVKFMINGDALKDAGFTKNMSQKYQLGEVSVRRVMGEIVKHNRAPAAPQQLTFYYDAKLHSIILTTRKFPVDGELVELADEKE